MSGSSESSESSKLFSRSHGSQDNISSLQANISAPSDRPLAQEEPSPGMSSGNESAAVLNLGNQSITLDPDPTEGIQLKEMCSGDGEGSDQSTDKIPPKPATVAVGFRELLQDTGNEKQKRPVYLKFVFEPWFWLLIFGLIFSYVLPTKFELNRTQETGLPSLYSYNLVRPICIDRKNYSNCLQLQENQTLFSSNFTLNDCIHNMTSTFRQEYCSKNLAELRMDNRTVDQTLNGSIFFHELTGSNDTTNEQNVLKYMTCVRVFQKNPFGEVHVFPKVDKFDFVLKNYKLLTDCGIIPPDSFFEYFTNLKRIYDFVTWVTGAASAVVLLGSLIRFYDSVKQTRQTQSSTAGMAFSNRRT